MAQTGLEYALIPTVDELKEYLGFSGDQQAQAVKELILEVTDDIEQWCRRKFISRTWDVYLNGNGRTKLMLPQWPVQSVTSCYQDRDDASELPVASITWDPDDGGRYLIALDGYTFWRGERNVHLTYVTGYLWAPTTEQLTAGYLQLPRSLVGVAKRLAARRWRRRKNLGEEIVSESHMGVSTRFMTEELTERDMAILKGFSY